MVLSTPAVLFKTLEVTGAKMKSKPSTLSAQLMHMYKSGFAAGQTQPLPPKPGESVPEGAEAHDPAAQIQHMNDLLEQMLKNIVVILHSLEPEAFSDEPNAPADGSESAPESADTRARR